MRDVNAVRRIAGAPGIRAREIQREKIDRITGTSRVAGIRDDLVQLRDLRYDERVRARVARILRVRRNDTHAVEQAEVRARRDRGEDDAAAVEIKQRAADVDRCGELAEAVRQLCGERIAEREVARVAERHNDIAARAGRRLQDAVAGDGGLRKSRNDSQQEEREE